jgi:CheY-like chemotaxis protein
VEKPFVLLADDNEATCTLLTALLGSDCNVETVSDGVEAIAKLRSRRYTAVVLDLLMPNLDGYGVLDFLVAERFEILPRVLVVTASLSPREMERVARYPIRCVVSKPFDIEKLKNAVRECLSDDDRGPTLPAIVGGGMMLLLADLLGHVR